MAQTKRADHLLVLEVLEGNGHLIFSLLVEDDLEAARVVVDFKQGAHGLLLLGSHAAHDNDLHPRTKESIFHSNEKVHFHRQSQSVVICRANRPVKKAWDLPR